MSLTLKGCVGEGEYCWECNEMWWAVVREELWLLLASAHSVVDSVFSPVSSTEKQEIFRCNVEFVAGALAHELNVSSHCFFCNEGRVQLLTGGLWLFLNHIDLSYHRNLNTDAVSQIPRVITWSHPALPLLHQRPLAGQSWLPWEPSIKKHSMYGSLHCYSNKSSTEKLQMSWIQATKGITFHLFSQIALADVY